MHFVVSFVLGQSAASECNVLMFWNTVSSISIRGARRRRITGRRLLRYLYR